MASIPAELASPASVRRDAFYWRFAGTALTFFSFGVAAALVGLVLLPVVRLAPGSRVAKRERARRVMQASFKLFVRATYRARLMTYDFRGVERLGRPGQLIVANHPSLIDVIFLLAFTPGAGCVVKQGLWRNPLTRSAVTLAEYISNSSAPEMIEGASAALQEGQSLLMFPEGTRTKPGQPPVFHRGAASVALRAAQVVTPVYVRCEPTTLTKAEPWYRIPPRRPHFSFIVGDDLDLDAVRGAPLPIASRRLNEQLQTQFTRVLTGM